MNKNGDLSKVDLKHAAAVGAGALAIAVGGGIIGEVLAPETAPALDKALTAVGAAILSGDSAGLLDLISSGGACG